MKSLATEMQQSLGVFHLNLFAFKKKWLSCFCGFFSIFYQLLFFFFIFFKIIIFFVFVSHVCLCVFFSYLCHF
jgi:hypothetical protein